MQSVDQIKVSDTQAPQVLADYADPVVFYCYALISTETAVTMDLITSKFPSDVSNYVQKALIQLEGDDLISFEDGKFKTTTKNLFNTINKSAQGTLLPSVIKAAAQTVVNDIDTGEFVKKSEDIDLYYVSDNSQTRARVKALVASFAREMRSIAADSLTNESNGVRLVAVVNSLPNAEVLL